MPSGDTGIPSALRASDAVSVAGAVSAWTRWTALCRSRTEHARRPCGRGRIVRTSDALEVFTDPVRRCARNRRRALRRDRRDIRPSRRAHSGTLDRCFRRDPAARGANLGRRRRRIRVARVRAPASSAADRLAPCGARHRRAVGRLASPDVFRARRSSTWPIVLGVLLRDRGLVNHHDGALQYRRRQSYSDDALPRGFKRLGLCVQPPRCNASDRTRALPSRRCSCRRGAYVREGAVGTRVPDAARVERQGSNSSRRPRRQCSRAVESRAVMRRTSRSLSIVRI